MTVAMIFPPVVSSGFGTYYPSLAVLSGVLVRAGLAVRQLDLNQELVSYLLEPDRLRDIGSAPVAQDEMQGVAARVLQANRDKLFDHQGRQQFANRRNSPAYLMSALARPYLIDLPVEEAIDQIQRGSDLANWYFSFFEQRDTASAVADCNLVGLSVAMGPQLFPALCLGLWLKARHPAIKVIMGGPTFSLMQLPDIERILEAGSFVDAIVRFDGEGPIVALARQVELGAWRPEQVPGTSCCVDGSAVHRAPGKGPALDELPYAEYDDQLVARLSNPELGVVQTRGCYWGRCAYCDFVELYDGSPRYRVRSADSFVGEVRHLIERHGTNRYCLITEAIPPSFALKFARQITDQSLQIAWSSFAMVDDHFSEGHFEAMAGSGCDHLVIGLETMSDRVLKHVGKYAGGDANERFLRQASACGIRLHVNLIPNLPSTTYREAMDSLARLEGLADTLEGVAIFPFEATRSSEIGRAPERYGLKAAQNVTSSGQAIFASNHFAMVDEAMTPDELAEVIQKYNEFASKINSRSHYFPTCNADINGALRVVENDNDILEGAHSTRVFNWRTRKRWEGPRGMARLIDMARQSGSSFTVDGLSARTGAYSETRFLVGELIERGVIAAANAGHEAP